MTGPTRSVDVQKLMSFADDLIAVLKNSRDCDILMQSCGAARSLRDFCEEEFNESQTSLQGYEVSIGACEQKIGEVEKLMISEAEMGHLQKELEEEVQRERLLRQELRRVSDEIADLERQRVSVEEQKATMKKKEKDYLKTQNMLSMCASVTRIVPDLDDQSKISGYIVDKDKKKYERFEYEPSLSSLEICNSLWEKVEL